MYYDQKIPDQLYLKSTKKNIFYYHPLVTAFTSMLVQNDRIKRLLNQMTARSQLIFNRLELQSQ